jgi:hypothetical protein
MPNPKTKLDYGTSLKSDQFEQRNSIVLLHFGYLACHSFNFFVIIQMPKLLFLNFFPDVLDVLAVIIFFIVLKSLDIYDCWYLSLESPLFPDTTCFALFLGFPIFHYH